MLMPSWMHDWGLPSRIALLLGLGAFSIAGAKADRVGEASPGGDTARVPQQSAKTFGDLLIWSDAGRIYVSEAGKPAEELPLGDSAEAEVLRQLLGREGATAATPRVLRDRIILVGGGGNGFSWQPPRQPDNAAPTPNPATDASPGGDVAKPAAATTGSASSVAANK
jgi:hypothetical protein